MADPGLSCEDAIYVMFETVNVDGIPRDFVVVLSEELPSFPVEHSYYKAVRERVDLARDIDKLEHVHVKKKHQNDWFVKAAKELEVDLDEHKKYPLHMKNHKKFYIIRIVCIFTLIK